MQGISSIVRSHTYGNRVSFALCCMHKLNTVYAILLCIIMLIISIHIIVDRMYAISCHAMYLCIVFVP